MEFEQTKQLLIVEDEYRLRRMIARALSHLQNVVIHEAGTLSEACRALSTHPLDLIVSDIDLPDGTGIELLQHLRTQQVSTPIVFMTAYLGVYGSQLPQEGGLIVLEKPFELDELRTMVNDMLSGGKASGERSPFSLVEYLQLACMGSHSVEMTVMRSNEVVGRVVVVSGELVSAVDTQTILGETAGEEALSRLLFEQDDQCDIKVENLRDAPGQKNISTPWQALLLDLARVHDETQAGRSGEDDAVVEQEGDMLFSNSDIVSEDVASDAEPAVPGIVDELAQLSFADVWEKGVDALLGKDYHRALSAFLAAERLRPDDPKVQTNLKRLRDLGIQTPH